MHFQFECFLFVKISGKAETYLGPSMSNRVQNMPVTKVASEYVWL